MSNGTVSRSRVTTLTYLHILISFMEGYRRLRDAELCALKLSAAFVRFHKKPRSPFEGSEYEDVLAEIRSVSDSSFDAAMYVNAVSNLVYATSLFDTFLTDTVTFLFLLVPESMGKELQIPLRLLLTSESRDSVIQQVVTNKARELSFKTFADRLQFFRDKFGMPVTVSASEIEKLVRLTNLRNSAVHDQGILELKLNRSGTISSGLKSSPSHPTKVSHQDANEAAELYYRIVERIGFDVLIHVLKRKESSLPPELRPYGKEISARARKRKVSTK